MMRIIEVGPRDGLQNEPEVIPTDVKVAFVNALSRTGLRDIEVSAFVSPKWVPQLADAEDVFARIERNPDVAYSALVPNLRGYARAQKAGVDRIALFTAASEAFTQHNINTSIDGSFERFAPVAKAAQQDGMPMRGYISTAFLCPYEGEVPADRVLGVVDRLLDLGVDEISIGDTIGKATSEQVARLLDKLLAHHSPDHFSMHFHDTYGRAVEHIFESIERGVTRFDSSTGGVGGCPYAPGAAGNVATESVVRSLQVRGYETGVDVNQLVRAAHVVRRYLHQRRVR